MFEPLRDSSMAKEKKMDAREFEELSRKLYEKQDQIEMQKRELLEKQSEMEESLDRYADLYDFAPNGYFTLDENGIIKDINYTGAQMLGVQKKLVLGLPFIHFLSKDNFQKYLNDLRDARQSFAQVSDDFQINPEKKMDCFIHLVLTPLRDYRNNELCFRVSITDVTDKKKIEDELIESEKRFRTMAEYSPVMIWISDMNLNIVYANKTKLDFLKRTFDEVKDQNWLETIHPDDRNNFLAVVRDAYDKEKNFTIELRVDCKGDGYRWVMLSAAPRQLPDGKMIGFTGSDVDITEKINARIELEDSLREKEILLKEIHHRIKNNLQIISSLLNLQLNYLENEEIIELLKSSQSRIRSMAMIHEKLYNTKELSRINFGEYAREFTNYLFNAYRSKIGSLRLELDLADVYLDINLSISLGLILNELITNALKHAFPNNRPGKVGISLKEENGQVQLIVTDDGEGLPQNFDIKKTNSLGLELVDSLVEQHKGRLEISTEGFTEFRILLKKDGRKKNLPRNI